MSQSLMIDFHSHILPKMDDGSKSLEMSKEMLKRMGDYGTELVFATSHCYGHKEPVERFLRRRQHAWETLKEHLEPGDPEVRLGAEVAFFSGLTQLDSELLDQLCLEGTHTILLEMPFHPWSGFELDAVSELILDRGYGVIMAHFERFLPFQTDWDIWDRVMQLPVQLQMNAETLIPWFKRGKWLEYFKNSRKIPVLGSDSHNLDKRAPNLGPARDILRKKLGQDVLNQIDQRGMQLVNRSPEPV